jgi:putative ATP-binding cassette transporter
MTRGVLIREGSRLLRPFRHLLLVAAACGAAAGLGTVALLATVNQALHRPEGLANGLLVAFLGLCAVTLIGRGVSDTLTNRVGQRLVAEVRTALGRKILEAPIAALERYRSHRLLPVLTKDVDMISDVAFLLASLLIACAVTLGCLAYLAWLSLPMFLLLLVSLGLGSIIQYRARARAIRGYRAAREGEDTLHKAYRAISEGAKELRINRRRRATVFGAQIEATIDRIRVINETAMRSFVAANAIGSALLFLVIGLLLAWQLLLPAPDQAVLSGFVLVLLYVKGPMDQIIAAIPTLGRAQVAFARIAELSDSFATPEPGVTTDRPVPEAQRIESIALRGLRYAFPVQKGSTPFTLGPIDLTIRRGEIVFIVGDNGSGKTTLIKLLLGLYVPTEGELLLDGRPVTDRDRDDYRQLFTTVFADYHLFEELAEDAEGLADRARPYLERLEIAHKVSVVDGSFSTTDLSTGQRKRLALVQAYLERRPVVVFDEWAADQDPTFRRIFYTELLPELRDQGRTLVVISHDDRYFDVADRIIRLDAGRIRAEEAAALKDASR